MSSTPSDWDLRRETGTVAMESDQLPADCDWQRESTTALGTRQVDPLWMVACVRRSDQSDTVRAVRRSSEVMAACTGVAAWGRDRRGLSEVHSQVKRLPDVQIEQRTWARCVCEPVRAQAASIREEPSVHIVVVVPVCDPTRHMGACALAGSIPGSEGLGDCVGRLPPTVLSVPQTGARAVPRGDRVPGVLRPAIP